MEKYYSCNLNFATRYADFDFCDNLKTSAILNFMQEAAGISGNELGCGSKFLWPKGWGFILTHNYVEVYKPIKINEERLTVKTWPLPPKHIIFERHYELYNEAGEKAVAAVSRWCLLDLKNKKFLSSSALEDQDYSTYNPAKTIDFKAWKIPPVSLEGIEPSFSVQVHSSEYDHYLHVNNTRYADFCMNCFTVEELKNKTVKSFQISYEEQCVEGDELNFYRVSVCENEFIIVGVKQENKPFMRVKIEFFQK